MTDQEMAMAIGKRVIELRHQKAALVGVLATCRTLDGNEIPFRKQACQLLDAPEPSQKSAEQSLSLRLLIEPQPDCQATILALYRFVFGEVDEV
jgi:hypothetical protein